MDNEEQRARDVLERVARAICKAKGGDPDMCVQGGGSVSESGYSETYCNRRAWHEELPSAQAALNELAADRPAIEGDAVREAKPRPLASNPDAITIEDDDFETAYVLVGSNVYFDQDGEIEADGLCVLSRVGAGKLARSILAALDLSALPAPSIGEGS